MISYKLVANLNLKKTTINKIKTDRKNLIYKKSKTYRKVKLYKYGIMKTLILTREDLVPNKIYNGPIILEEDTSTVMVKPNQSIKLDEYGLLRIKV
jgi:N-methylhydantoinase A